MVRFIHTADLQLGMTRHFLGEDAQARFADARIDAVRKIGALAREVGAAFVVVAGDVFESSFVSPQTVLRALDAFEQVPVPVYLLPGNHDALDAASLYRSKTFREHQPAHVRVIEDGAPIDVRPGVQVVGAPWKSKHPVTDLVGAMCRELTPFDGVRVAVGHGIVDVLNPDRTSLASISLAEAERALADGRIHFLALGDRHSATDVGATGRVWYAGAPEVTDFDEAKPGYALVVDVAEDGAVTVDERAIGSWRFRLVDAELTSDEDLAAFDARLKEFSDKTTTVLKLVLRGALTVRQSLELDRIIERCGALFAAVTSWERHTDLVIRPDDGESGGLELSGFARHAFDQIAARVATEDAAKEAMALLHRLAAGVRS